MQCTYQKFCGVGVLPVVSLRVEHRRGRGRRLLFGIVLVAVGFGGAHAVRECEGRLNQGQDCVCLFRMTLVKVNYYSPFLP